MHKKLVAALTIAIFALSSVAIIAPASAFFTLGDLTPTPSYHANDVDPHVAGPLGWVFPGSGLAALTGNPNGFPPGYQTPQVQGNSYEPFGAVLTSTADHSVRGPLIFAFNFSNPCSPTLAGPTLGTNAEIRCDSTGTVIGGPMLNFTGVSIYLPPEFDLTSALNNYGLIESTFGATAADFTLTQQPMTDPFGPGWWLLSFEGVIQFWPQHQYRDMFYIRINDVASPMIAGKYFFKMFLWDSNTDSGGYQMAAPGAWDVHSALTTPAGQSVFIPPSGATWLTFPAENWPVILVKGELDPGIIEGTIRYGTFNQTLYGQPLNLPGKVWATGVAIDPYASGHPTTGRNVTAMGYFNASAAGHYEVEGVAPGIYTIYAQAAGYPAETIASNVTILAGQSFHLDGYLQPGPVVHGQIYSKHLFGEEPWPSNPRPIEVVLYSANDYATSSIVAWSPWNKTQAPYMAYDWPMSSSFPHPLPVAYPWFAPAPFAQSYYSQSFPAYTGAGVTVSDPTVTGLSNGPFTCGGTVDPCGKPDGVGPAQYWWVDAAGQFTNGGGSSSFIFAFGVKGVYGAPTDIDGHVPQTYATWVNGLTAGRYWIRAYLNGYVQTLQDGVTLDEYPFEVAQNEWAGDIFQPMDLRVSSTIVKTVHFHDLPGTLTECPISGCAGNPAVGQSAGDRYLIAEVRDSSGNLVGMNFTYVPQAQSNAIVEINGFGMMGPDPEAHYYADGGLGQKYSYYMYQGYFDYGLPSGTYTVYTYMRGYVQQTYESVSVTLSGSPALISNHMYRGVRLNITLFSIDWEHPTVVRPWEFPGARLRVYIFNDKGQSFSHVGSRHQPSNNPFYVPTPAAPGPVNGITGSCNVAQGDTANYCKINEWDGYRLLSDALDTPPDYYGGNTAVISWSGHQDPFFAQDGFLNFPTSYYRRGASTNFAARDALETGTYSAYGFTYGYLQAQDYSVYVQKGGFGDIKVNLLQGVNITINIPFKKEGIYTPTEFNMSMRVRVFDENGAEIASAQTKVPDSLSRNSANINGIARADPVTGKFGSAGFYTYYVDPYAISPDQANGLTSIDSSPKTADTFLWYGDYYGTGKAAWQAFDSDVGQRPGTSTAGPVVGGVGAGFQDGLQDFGPYNPQYGNYYTWIPAGTQQVRVFIAGVYDYLEPLNGLFSGVLKGRTLDDKEDWFAYGIPGSSSTLPEGVPVAYSGKYYAEVDTWNEYPAPTYDGFVLPPAVGHVKLKVGTPASASGLLSAGPMPALSNWYPPVQGLLEGDSFHTIPGASPNVFGFTGASLAANQLGPYAQDQVWEIPNGHLGSEVSVVYELDKRGYIQGTVFGFTWANDLRTESWFTVQVSAAVGNLTGGAGNVDGVFDAYLDPGQYSLAVIAWSPAGQGYSVVKAPITVTAGQATTGITFQLERSSIPIPEFSGLAVVAFSALAASVYLLRRRRR